MDSGLDNLVTALRRTPGWRLPCLVEAQVGEVVHVPYAGNIFDVVQRATVSQHLSDTTWAEALTEMRRAVCLGGLIAVEELDPTLDILLRTMDCTNLVASRGRGLYQRLRDSGLVHVWQQLTPVDRFAPFDPATEAAWKHVMMCFAQTAALEGISAADRATWHAFSDPEGKSNPLNSAYAYVCEGYVLAVGQVPWSEQT